MKIIKITDRTTMFTVPEKGGSINFCLIMGEHRNYIIDTGVGASSVNEMLSVLGCDDKPIITVNTHAHWDHILGNWALDGRLIVAHTLCREIMDKDWDSVITDWLPKIRDYIDPEIHKCLPNLTFDSTLHFPEDGISLFHTPGHSPDSISVYDAVDKTLYTADSFGVSDGVAYLWGENPDDYARMIETYKQYDFTTCILSHGEPQTREVIQYLETALAKARNEQS